MPPILFFRLELRSVFAEQHSDAPHAGKTYKRINNATDQGILTAKQPGYQIKLENTYKAPVQRADNGKN